MKKIYVQPAMRAEEAQVVSILATSLSIGKTTVSGEEALVKENDWNIWGDEEE